jgi:hypothetical protein
MQNFDHNIGFWEKRQFFRLKLSKISENCDHNIDPWSLKKKISQTCRKHKPSKFLEQNISGQVYRLHSRPSFLVFFLNFNLLELCF